MRQVAAIFGVSVSYIYKALLRRRVTGDSRAWLLRQHGVSLSMGALWQALQRLKMSFKNAVRAVEQDLPDVARLRRVWKAA